MKMPNDERAKIEKNSLTQEHLDDITEFQDGLAKAWAGINDFRLGIRCRIASK